jgi:hypothetical protein
MLDTTAASERALIASEVWSLAKKQGDDRLRVAALQDYRAAMRDLHANRRQLDSIKAECRARATGSW